MHLISTTGPIIDDYLTGSYRIVKYLGELQCADFPFCWMMYPLMYRRVCGFNI
jgi:hypothetical protein